MKNTTDIKLLEKDTIENSDGENSKGFIKEVAKYFMNFLETDFKKRRIPKRNTIQKTKKGLRVGLDLEKYPKLKQKLLSSFYNGFERDTLKIKQNQYTANISHALLNLITRQINELNQDDLLKVFKQIEHMLNESFDLFEKEYDKFLENAVENVKNILDKYLILQFLNELDKPLDNLLDDYENSKYQLKVDIVDCIFSLFENKIEELFENYFHSRQTKIVINFIEAITPITSIEEIKEQLIDFFDSFAVSDAFQDIYQLFKNKNLIDKSEIYIYFYEISLTTEKFPIFYLPVSISKNEKIFSLNFGKRIFINTKAIDFVVQEYNLANNNNSTLAGDLERIIYINDEKDIVKTLSQVIIKLETFFKFNKNINLNDTRLQKNSNLTNSLSNKSYFFLFDQSDEALINDYEEILNDESKASINNGHIIKKFSNLLNGFIEDSPKSCITQVDEDWMNKNIPDKLIFESPIPLNDEQKQVLIALKKPDCKFVILEGPPGTGKSHTITAIICRALLEEKSVLVLSDKKEALDVVEDKISETLNKVRHDNDFQNPILRLGKSGNKFYKIVQGQTIRKIKEHYLAYKHKKLQFDKQKDTHLNDLSENIKANIKYFKNIKMNEIEFYFKNFDKFSVIKWLDYESISEDKQDILKLKKYIHQLQSFASSNFKLSFVSDENYNRLLSLLESLEELESHKNLFENLRNYSKIIDGLELYNYEDRKNISDIFSQIQLGFSKVTPLYNEFTFLCFESMTDDINLQETLAIEEALKEVNILKKIINKYISSKQKDVSLINNFIFSDDLNIESSLLKFNNILVKAESFHQKIENSRKEITEKSIFKTESLIKSKESEKTEIITKNNFEIKSLIKSTEAEKTEIITKTNFEIELLEKSNVFLENKEKIEYLQHFIFSESANVDNIIEHLNKFVIKIKESKSPLLGYLFKSKKINQAMREVKQKFYNFKIEQPHKKINIIEDLYYFYKFLQANSVDDDSFRKILNYLCHGKNAGDLENRGEILIDNLETEKSTLIDDLETEKSTLIDGLKTEKSTLIDDLETERDVLLKELEKKKLDELDDVAKRLKDIFQSFDLKDKLSIEALRYYYDLLNFIHNKTKHNNKKLFSNIMRLLSEESKVKSSKMNLLTNQYKMNLLTNQLSNLSENIKAIEYFHNVKISEIKNYKTFIDILNISDNILKETENIGIDDLKYTNLENDIIKLNNIKTDLGELLKIEDKLEFISNFYSNNKNISENINLKIEDDNLNKLSCALLEHDDKFILEYLKYKDIEVKLDSQFNELPEDMFSNTIKEIEDLTTAEMTYFLDKRIVEYTQDYASEVGTLKNIIKNKQKFPKGLFKNLKKAFPCILAGIRDYAEYIPLEENLFDLIIIDEASQVSIAQALPALIRGKQIIVLGDDKQFSNVKSGNANKITNQQYKTKITKSFHDERIRGRDDLGWITKVKDNFDIKNSILKFSRFIRNYECQLRKHFRCYPEIISYSDKYFYDNTLQCMKIRGRKIDEVIKFDVIEHDGKIDEAKNINELEVNFIIEKLLEFYKNDLKQSIGIITPHREQVSLLWEKITNLQEKDWLFDSTRKLKIMTFDTCQGEERDYIFYSMVATKEKDRLNWIFPVSFDSLQDKEDGNVKSQRLNVGFSRAKESIHFVLSKKIEEFQGEIKNAMIHYKNELKNGNRKIIGNTDPKSPMEDKIQEYFYSTKFYKDNQNKIEFIPQFDLGKYLKQLDNNYKHPNYKVDFLLIFDNEKIIIEYDGFKEHFENLNDVNESNYEFYMKDDDIYRQKVLEGYGYKFLRINKFNIGTSPVETLNHRLEELVLKKKVQNSIAVNNLHNQINKLKNKEDRFCEGCNKILSAQLFPYKTVNLCIYCYERINNITLKTFRNKNWLFQRFYR